MIEATETGEAKGPGRVYDVNPDPTKGERDGRGLRVYTGVGDDRWLEFVTRVEFDADADEGPATVTALVKDSGGQPFANLEGTVAVAVTFRAAVRLAPKPVDAETADPVPASPAAEENPRPKYQRAVTQAVSTMSRMRNDKSLAPADLAARVAYEALAGVDRVMGTGFAREWYPLANGCGMGHRGRPWPM